MEPKITLLQTFLMILNNKRLINTCGSLNCSFIMTYVMLTTFISYFTLLVLWLSGKTE